MEKILITGSSGQLGSELSVALAKVYGENQVIAADIHKSDKEEISLYFELLENTHQGDQFSVSNSLPR